MDEAQREKLRRSIKTYGCVELIIWNERSGRVVSGHQRLNALRELGETAAQCVVVDLDENNERALSLAMNKIGGAWDFDKLREVLASFSADFDVTLSGFDLAEIREMTAKEIQPQDDNFDLDAALEEITESVTQPGEVWKLGEHRLMCGDAVEENDFFRLMRGEKAQLVLTDPPYNVDYHAKAGCIKNDNMQPEEFKRFLDKAFSFMNLSSVPGAAAYIFHADTTGETFRAAFRAGGWELKQVLVWVKNHFALGRQDYHWRHEPILYGTKPGAAHYFAPERTHTTVIDAAPPPDPRKLTKPELLELAETLLAAQQGEPQTVIRADKPSRSAEHPTMKPVPLLGQLIQNSSRPGEIVLDPFAGSGSTLVACEQLGRAARCMEISPRFCDVILRRWEEMTGQKAEKA
jgi:DNA modification methylase